jgi:hypothetical protein
VLVVEDEAIIAMHLERVLEDAGWEVVGPVAHQLAALRLARREPLDAALLDLDLRGRSGAPVAEALVARGVPVVVLSGGRGGLPPGPLASVRRLQKPYRPRSWCGSWPPPPWPGLGLGHGRAPLLRPADRHALRLRAGPLGRTVRSGRRVPDLGVPLR